MSDEVSCCECACVRAAARPFVDGRCAWASRSDSWRGWRSRPGPGRAASKDDDIDALLQKLSGTTGGPEEKPSDKASASKTEAGGEKKPGAQGEESRQGRDEEARGSTPLTGKDKEVDELLQKLGETVETPAPDDVVAALAAVTRTKPADLRQQQEPQDQDRLTGKDKETRPAARGADRQKAHEEGGRRRAEGAAGEIIKEMRDIEQRLGKPETGEATRQEQKKIVKQIETLIEQAAAIGLVVDAADGHPSATTARPEAGQATRPDRRGHGPRRPALEAAEAHRSALQGRRQGHLGPSAARAAGRRSKTCSRSSRSPARRS